MSLQRHWNRHKQKTRTRRVLGALGQTLGGVSDFSVSTPGTQMSFQKHNQSSVFIPADTTRLELRNRLKNTTLGPNERAVARIVLDTGGVFVLTVQHIIQSAGWRTKKTWPKTRNNLIAAGLLEVGFEPLPGKAKKWFLKFDFTPLAIGMLDEKLDEKLSTDEAKKGGSRARACDPPQKGVSRDPPLLGVSTLETFQRKIPPPPPHSHPVSNGGVLSIKKREEELLATATDEQRQFFFATMARPRTKIRDIAAYRIDLAKKAAGGLLTGPINVITACSPISAEAGPDFWLFECEKNSDLAGVLTGPNGPVARARSGAAGTLVCDKTGRTFDYRKSAKLWLQLAAGEQ